MPVCRYDNIYINYEVHREGVPVVLAHPFTASTVFWTDLIRSLPSGYQAVLYDIRGHGLSSAPAGEDNYRLDILVADLHQLVEHLDIKQAYVGGLSLGGAVALGYAARHPEKVKALMVFDIHGGFQPPSDPVMQAEMAQRQEKTEKYILEHGMVDFARRQLETGTAFPPVPDDEDSHQKHVERMARVQVNGYFGIGRAKPWEEEWQREAADGIEVPTLITVGSDDLPMVVSGTQALHEHIKGSRYVIIGGAVHETARWRPDAFNRVVVDFLKTVEAGKPVAEEITID